MNIKFTEILCIYAFVIPILMIKGEIQSHNHAKLSNFQHKSSSLQFITLGDWGADTPKQKQDANAMGRWCDKNKCDFVLALGDNFYTHGVDSATDSRFATTWSDVYDYPSIANLTWFVTAGNHDHGNDARDGREWYEVEHYKLDKRWHFPNLSYAFNYSTPSSRTKFVAYDTQSIIQNKNNASGIISFLKSELNDPTATWKIVFGHHPCYSCGHYDGVEEIRDQVLPILKQNDVDVYVTGHEHNQEHWQDKDHPNIDHVVTGAGGNDLYEYNPENHEKMKNFGMDLKFFAANYSFSYFTINDNSLSWKFVNSSLHVLYEHTRQK